MLNTNDGLINISTQCNISEVSKIISENPYWMQMNIPETLTIPSQKPDAEQINSVNISVDIFRAEVIKVPLSPSNGVGGFIPNLEGKISTGRKLIIEGQLCQKIGYTADYPEQPYHSADFYVPFSSYIVMPKEVKFADGTKKDPLYVDFQVNSCIEDVSIKLLDSRTILKHVTMLLYAVPSESL